jgi:UDP-N-acetylmuramoyl-tripeptide--D-alanyl-D-alanine ligase
MSVIIEPWTLGEIAEAAGGELVAGSPETMIHGVTTDSRSVPPRGLFVALRGPNHDAHDYVHTVAEAGARAALVERALPIRLDFGLVRVADTTRALGLLAARHRARFRPRVVAITGSSGKTTTKAFLAAIFRRRFRTVATEGNLNNHIGVPLTLFGIGRHTERAVVEMGMSNAGEIGWLASLAAPQVGIITSIGPAHLLTLKTIERVADAKAELIEELNRLNGVVVLDRDQPFFENLAECVTCRLVTVGAAEGADLRVRGIAAPGYGPASFVYRGLGINLRQSGRHVISNAILAAAAAEALGADPSDVAAGLAEVYPVPGRSSITRLSGVTLVDDAYNANPLSYRAALAQIASEPANRRIVVMADMLELGDASARYHAEIGAEIARAGIDVLIHRGEGAAEAAAAAAGVRTIACDSNAAIEETLDGLLLSGDLVLFKASHGTGLHEVARRSAEFLRRRAEAGRGALVALPR